MEPQNSAAQKLLVVQHFKNTGVGPAESRDAWLGVGTQVLPLHPAASEIPEGTPSCHSTHSTQPARSPRTSPGMLHLKVQFLDDSQKIFVVDVSGNHIAIVPSLFIQ
jgi:hypothetical protein